MDTYVQFSNVTYDNLVHDYNQIYTQFLGWYNTFFGPEGIITVNQTVVQDHQTTLLENTLTVEALNLTDTFAIEQPIFGAIPPQIVMIADWINYKFAPAIISSVKDSICGVPSMESNSTNSTNGTDSSNSTSGTPYNASNYEVPENCSISADNSSISCSDANNSANFTFETINNFFTGDLSDISSRLNIIDGACQDSECRSSQAESLFASKSLRSVYTWLYFDAAARSALFTELQNKDSNFSVSEANFNTFFGSI